MRETVSAEHLLTMAAKVRQLSGTYESCAVVHPDDWPNFRDRLEEFIDAHRDPSLRSSSIYEIMGGPIYLSDGMDRGDIWIGSREIARTLRRSTFQVEE